MKRNVSAFGLVIGLLAPLLGALVMYFAWFRNDTFAFFMQKMLDDHQLAAKVLSLSLLANLLPFIYYINKRLDLTAKGILIGTVLYFVLFILLKFDFFS